MRPTENDALYSHVDRYAPYQDGPKAPSVTNLYRNPKEEKGWTSPWG